ncbi:MAG: TetR/AcrR family transcriptional regulator [Myxococcales bacterium]|nr:TetR/AcrR family transcriptional regulator [Myxococcales bacterium]
MARQPTFDRAEVVRAAMEVFWREGYQGASIKQLGEAMGLMPGSIYAAFGSKEGLFREVLDAYVARVRGGASAERVAPRTILERWFAEHIAAATATPEGRGCLLLNSAFEVQAIDPGPAERVREELAALEAFFETCVKAARRGEGAEGRDGHPTPKATARLLVAALGGISMLSRAGASKRSLEDVARASLAAV